LTAALKKNDFLRKKAFFQVKIKKFEKSKKSARKQTNGISVVSAGVGWSWWLAGSGGSETV
jgi:hypothetical protein